MITDAGCVGAITLTLTVSVASVVTVVTVVAVTVVAVTVVTVTKQAVLSLAHNGAHFIFCILLGSCLLSYVVCCTLLARVFLLTPLCLYILMHPFLS